MNQNNRRPVAPQHPKKRKPKKSVGKSIFVVILLLVFAIIALSVAYLSFYKPKVDTDLPFDPTPDTNVTSKDPAKVEEPTAPVAQSGAYARKEGVYNFLIVGKDSVALNTDVIMLLSFDVKKGALSIMQIPRDTYIEVGGISHKINSAYSAFYVQAMRDDEKEPEKVGMQGFADLLQKNMTIKIDYYALVNLDGFRNIIDILGGVPMNVPFDMDYEDPYQDLSIHIQQGEQVLDGEQAEKFVRFRHSYLQGDVGRVNAQKIFLSALLQQMKTSITIDKVPALIDEVLKNMTTSISASDCVYFAKEALGVDMNNISMFTLPGTDARENVDSGAWYYVMYRMDTIEMVNRYLNVYDTAITDSIFDKNYAFTAEDKAHILSIYETPAHALEELDTYTADEINKEELPSIPLDS